MRAAAMRRIASGHQPDIHGIKRGRNVGGEPQMTVMDRVERTAEDRERNQKREPGCSRNASSSCVDSRPRTALR